MHNTPRSKPFWFTLPLPQPLFLLLVILILQQHLPGDSRLVAAMELRGATTASGSGSGNETTESLLPVAAATGAAPPRATKSTLSLPMPMPMPMPMPTRFLGPDASGDPVFLPLVGSGTWQYDDDEAYESVCRSFEQGSTMVDTAYGYGNQEGVGRAIRDCWKGDRSDLFVMTKIPGGLTASEVHRLHELNLHELGLDYVDHLMTHFPSDWKETHTGSAARQEEWLALEEIYYSKTARTIGISHYCPRHILDIMWVATVTPSVNQIEYHVGSGDVDGVRETCSELGIVLMAFSPLCGPCQYEPKDSLVTGDLVTSIARNYVHSSTGKPVTGSQVALRYVVQQGIPLVAKSHDPDHIRSNLDVFDFELSQQDMDKLGAAPAPEAEAGDCDVQFQSQMKSQFRVVGKAQ
eukprot:CAMPEP_0172378008 /NCGR_PEP_ID=MMETSP1060-20121228/69200_1 /TAXON_ID=37318 /ORGANISM="Pseudo-nitzschia pungens, Strain cf. cingulata" /LENGTH=406 /DNA_ID=CAMNT_0013105719 /DNA_START=247 /DNA_END=1467 /DNA_ORIENTATION=-